MMQQVINIGQRPRDGTGDPLRTAFDKANKNFTELYDVIGGVPTLLLQPTTWAQLSAPVFGMLACIMDSSTNVMGAAISGGGPYKVLAFFNGTHWTVAGV
jgi:hypothetical protein